MLFNKNDKAVSPIVATLVLIVVAIVGAIAVGVLMGAFNNDVKGQANAGDVANSYSQELTLAGSTTCYPVTAKLATAYMGENKEIKVTVGEGGSDAGLAGVESGSIMIGMASKIKDTTNHPEQADLVGYQIGGRGVAIIGGSGLTGLASVSPTTLGAAYADAANGIADVDTATGVTLYQRLDGSGTEEAVAKYVGDVDADHAFGTSKSLDSSTALSVTGNEGVLAAVKANANSLGFVDWGYVDSEAERTGIVLIPVSDATITTAVTPSNDVIKAALKDVNAGATTSSNYPAALVSPLMYYTKGDANTLAQSFIDYAKSPAQLNLFHDVGVFGISEM